MNRHKLIRIMPNVWGSKDMLLCLLAVAALVFISIMGIGKLGFAYAEAGKVQEEIAAMTSFIADWEKQSAVLRQEAYHPVAAGRVDEVQAHILTILSKHRLDLASFRTVSGDDKKANGKTFELNCRGTWESTIRMLEKVRAQNALISIQRLKLEPDRASGGVNTTLEYKIYTK